MFDCSNAMELLQSRFNFVFILEVNNQSLFNFQYVGYARTYVNPKLTPAAAEVLQVSFNEIGLIVVVVFFFRRCFSFFIIVCCFSVNLSLSLDAKKERLMMK